MLTDIAAEVHELRLVDTHEHLGLPWRQLSEADWSVWLRSPQAAEQEWVEAGPDILRSPGSRHSRSQ